MCRAVTCKKCRKTTWAGCGQHVDQVMRGVARDERCDCATNPPAEAPRRGLLASLFRR